jgi:hypothetical protein
MIGHHWLTGALLGASMFLLCEFAARVTHRVRQVRSEIRPSRDTEVDSWAFSKPYSPPVPDLDQLAHEIEAVVAEAKATNAAMRQMIAAKEQPVNHLDREANANWLQNWRDINRGSAFPLAAALLVASLSGCSTAPTQAQTDVITAGATTLAAIAAANNTTVAHLVTQGALFCQAAGPAVTAPFVLANAAGAPVSVTGQAASAVAAACAALQAIPVPPPVAPASTPVVAAPAVLLPAVVPVPAPAVPMTGAKT